jgi:hypothetical protein
VPEFPEEATEPQSSGVKLDEEVPLRDDSHLGFNIDAFPDFEAAFARSNLSDSGDRDG